MAAPWRTLLPFVFVCDDCHAAQRAASPPSLGHVTTALLHACFFPLFSNAALEDIAPTRPLAKLAAAMPRAVFDESRKILTLPDGVQWPDLKSSVLFVRHFYKDLWEGALNRCRAGVDGVDGAVVFGTSGSEFFCDWCSDQRCLEFSSRSAS